MNLQTAQSSLDADSFSMFYIVEARAFASMYYSDMNFIDEEAIKIVQKHISEKSIDETNKEFIKSIVVRTKLFDHVLNTFLKQNTNVTVFNLGSGLCTRETRILQENSSRILQWINVDLSDALNIRKSIIHGNNKTKNISCNNIQDATWFDDIHVENNSPVFIIMEGVSPYMSQRDIEKLISNIAENSKHRNILCRFLFDYCHPFYNYSNTALNNKISKQIEFKSGFTSIYDIIGISDTIVLKNIFTDCTIINEHTNFRNDFLQKNNGEEPYTIAELEFDPKKKDAAERLYYFDKELFWNTEFAIHILNNETVIFLSEKDSLFYSYYEYRNALSFLKGEGNGSLNNEIIAVSIIQQFIEQNLLIEEVNQSYIVPNFDRSFTNGKYNGAEILFLTQENIENIAHRLLADFHVGEETSVVFVDDYLDPRLSEINKQFLQNNKPWMLICLTGKEIKVGPLFNPAKKHGICYDCMSALLWKNNPIRKFIYNKNKKHQGIPLYFSEDNIRLYLQKITKLAEKVTSAESNSMFYSFNTTTEVELSHCITKPNCNTCNNNVENNLLIQTPVILQSGIKIPNSDGGFRTVHPKDSLKKLQPYISSYVGIVHPLQCIGNENEGFSVYSSSFARYPNKKKQLTPNDFIQYTLGKGVFKEQSKMSALSEAIERHNSLFSNTEEYVFCKAEQLDAPAFIPHQLKTYSKNQYKYFDQHPEAILAVKEFPEDEELHWTPVYSLLSEKKAYVPLSYCLSNTGFKDEEYIRFNSNGCAAGNTIEEAILQGFLELIERDAVAIWWYNKIRRSAIKFDDKTLPINEKIKHSLSDKWDHWLLDITHDFEIPVVVAVAQNKITKEFRLGFGAHLHLLHACSRAYTELHQIIASDSLTKKDFQFSHITDSSFLIPLKTKELHEISYSVIVNNDIKDDISFCLKQASRCNFDVFLYNTTRKTTPLFTVKVIIPGLNFIWPELGNKRLYELPMNLEWMDKQKQECELNKLELFL